jgi:prevent-host-death family protein
MTSCDYLVTMQTVRIADLKAKLSEYLRAVRGGATLTVLDRATPIARIVPFSREPAPLRLRRPMPNAPALHRVRLPPPLKLRVDAVALLLEERQGGR